MNAAILVVHGLGQTTGHWLGTLPLSPGRVLPQTLRLLADRIPGVASGAVTTTTIMAGARIISHSCQSGLTRLSAYVLLDEERLEVETQEYGDGSIATTVRLPDTGQEFILAGHETASALRPEPNGTMLPISV